MKSSQKIILVLALIAGVICSVLYNLKVPEVKMAYKHTVTEENYQELKDYIIEVTKNASKMKPDPNIQIITGFSDEKFVIIADTKFYGVKAEFTTSELKVNFDNGTLRFDPCNIDYNSVKYTEHSKVKSIAYYVCVTLFISVLPVGIIYTLFYGIPQEYKKNTRKS